MPPAEWTILSILEWTTGYFRTHAIESPRLDAEVLLAHSLGLRRIDLYLRYDQPLAADELAAFRATVKRRAAREPVAYITGRREFWGLTLAVDRHVLCPRPETERVVEVALEGLPGAGGGKPLRALDLGTGSGCIALALARECPTLQVLATDISRPALALARRNLENHGLADRVQLVAGRDLDMLPDRRAAFDLIASNPPYIPSAEISALEPEVKDYEPRGALDGGADGLAAYRRILPAAGAALRPGGLLILEIGWDQGPAVTRLAEATGLFGDHACLADYSGQDRVIRLVRAG
jgi:release factor glutamine methyltransferase